jgi:TPR repeat protein
MYAHGQGLPQDYAEAVKWYRKAADQGYEPAQELLGVAYANGQGVPQGFCGGLRLAERGSVTRRRRSDSEPR